MEHSADMFLTMKILHVTPYVVQRVNISQQNPVKIQLLSFIGTFSQTAIAIGSRSNNIDFRDLQLLTIRVKRMLDFLEKKLLKYDTESS